MILAWLGATAWAGLTTYNVPVTAVAYSDGRQYVGTERADGGDIEVPALSFVIAFNDAATTSLGVKTLSVDEIDATWDGQSGTVATLRLYRDDGDLAWGASDTLIAEAPLAEGVAKLVPVGETLTYPVAQGYHVTVVLSGASASGCALVEARLDGASAVHVSDTAALADPVVPSDTFPVVSTSDAADADVLESAVAIALADEPDDTVAGYAVTSAWRLDHCDGSTAAALASSGTVDVLQDGAAFDVATFPANAADGLFDVTWTVPTDVAGDTFTFSLPAGSLDVADSYGTIVPAPSAGIETSPFLAVVNPGPFHLVDRTGVGAAPAGSIVPVTVAVLDPNDVPAEGVDVSFALADALDPPGSLSADEAATDADGEATIAWTLSTSAGTNKLGVTIADDGVVIAIEGSTQLVDAETSELDVPEDAIAGDAVPIEVVARDTDGNPIAGATVSLATTLGGVAAPDGSTASDGTYATTLVAPEGEALVSATVDGIALGPAAVEVRAVPVTGFDGPAWPNPLATGDTLHVPWALAEDADLTIRVLDTSGRVLSTPLSSREARGYGEADVGAFAAAPGAYVIELSAGDVVERQTVAVAGSGCGCAGAPAPSPLGLAVAVLLAARRRRR